MYGWILKSPPFFFLKGEITERQNQRNKEYKVNAQYVGFLVFFLKQSQEMNIPTFAKQGSTEVLLQGKRT